MTSKFVRVTSFQYLLLLVSVVNPSFRLTIFLTNKKQHTIFKNDFFWLSCVNIFPDLSKNRSDARYGEDSEKTSLLVFVSGIADGRNHGSKSPFTWRWGTPGRWGNLPSRGRKKKRVYIQSYNPGVLRWGFLRLLLRLKLRSLSRGVPSSHLEKDEKLILGHICIYSWKRHALCYAVLGYARTRWLNTLYRIVWETKYGKLSPRLTRLPYLADWVTRLGGHPTCHVNVIKII